MENETEVSWRRGNWMQTFTGKQFYPLDAIVDDIDSTDIAHALSHICRYGGHVDRFYSVAEHCFLMSQAVRPENRLWALLHDATEAYIGDMVRPLKLHMPNYVDVEDRLMAVIAQRFGLKTEWRLLETGQWIGTTFRRFDVPVMPDEVREADSRILLTERAALMANTRHPWDIEGLVPLPVEIQGWGPERAKMEYALALEDALEESGYSE